MDRRSCDRPRCGRPPGPPVRFRRRDYCDGTDRPLGDAAPRRASRPRHRPPPVRPGPHADPAAHAGGGSSTRSPSTCVGRAPTATPIRSARCSRSPTPRGRSDTGIWYALVAADAPSVVAPASRQGAARLAVPRRWTSATVRAAGPGDRLALRRRRSSTRGAGAALARDRGVRPLDRSSASRCSPLGHRRRAHGRDAPIACRSASTARRCGSWRERVPSVAHPSSGRLAPWHGSVPTDSAGRAAHDRHHRRVPTSGRAAPRPAERRDGPVEPARAPARRARAATRLVGHGPAARTLDALLARIDGGTVDVFESGATAESAGAPDRYGRGGSTTTSRSRRPLGRCWPRGLVGLGRGYRRGLVDAATTRRRRSACSVRDVAALDRPATVRDGPRRRATDRVRHRRRDPRARPGNIARPLRPGQRLLRAVPRRDDDLLAAAVRRRRRRTLAEASPAKLDRLCRRLGPRRRTTTCSRSAPGGARSPSTPRPATGAEVTTTTISAEQHRVRHASGSAQPGWPTGSRCATTTTATSTATTTAACRSR